jgi:hypothetical protein
MPFTWTATWSRCSALTPRTTAARTMPPAPNVCHGTPDVLLRQVCRSKADGTWAEYGRGMIDNIGVLQGVASEGEIARLANGRSRSLT